MGLLEMEDFLCPLLLICREEMPVSKTFPELQRVDLHSCWQRKEGDTEIKEKQLRNNSAALGQGPSSASRDTYNKIFKLCCRTKTPTKWKMF